MIKDSARSARQTDAPESLLCAASKLFAQRGIDGVSTREITVAAGVNSAAIGYHFGTKENLAREVFKSLAGPVNRTRLDALTAYESSVGPKAKLDVAQIVRCFVEPALRAATDPTHESYHLGRLLLLLRTLSQPWVSEVSAEEFDVVFKRFVAAFQRALPRLSHETLCWRYDLMVGMVLVATGYFDPTSRTSTRIVRVTDGLCVPTDTEKVIQQVVNFAIGAIQGPDTTS